MGQRVTHVDANSRRGRQLNSPDPKNWKQNPKGKYPIYGKKQIEKAAKALDKMRTKMDNEIMEKC